MSVQFSIAVRNARLDAIESITGASAKLRLYTGAQPANCAAPASGTLIDEISLPADWMNNASAGSKSILGSWTASATGAGTNTAGHYRLMDSTGTTCHEQGSVTISGGGGDLTLDNPVIANGQVVTITSWSKTDGNA